MGGKGEQVLFGVFRLPPAMATSISMLTPWLPLSVRLPLTTLPVAFSIVILIAEVMVFVL